MGKRVSGSAGPPERPRLTVARDSAADLIKLQIQKGEDLLAFAKSANSPYAYSEKNQPWRDYTGELLRKLFTVDELVGEFQGYGGAGDWDPIPLKHLNNLVKNTERSLQSLRSILDRLELYDETPGTAGNVTPSVPTNPASPPGRDVFIVHGRDEATKQTVARFLEKLDLNPIILHEQPDKGRTIIEKFEDHSSVGFAVVLLTPDDEGRLTEGGEPLRKRARQNVILELGYFIGLLGRGRVCALKVDGVEEPSDLHGVLYVPFDGTWTLRLAKELKAAGIEVDMNRAV